MWNLLGFTGSPYNTDPLRVLAEDVPMLIGREHELSKIYTALDASSSGVFIVSGLPGVGKTSFVNVAQYQLESDEAPYGPNLLAARERCTIRYGDTPREIALRALNTLCKNVQNCCAHHGYGVPDQVRSIAGWVNSRGRDGFTLNLSIAGIGGGYTRNINLSTADSSSFENISDAIQCVSQEAKNKLPYSGSFIILDNTESLSEDNQAKMLMDFRDTLFEIDHIWWIVIGQSGLGSLLRTKEPKVADRLSGFLELSAVSAEDFHKAIEERVQRFTQGEHDVAPLSKSTHEFLFISSTGEMRFVFQKANQICERFVAEIRETVIAMQPKSVKIEKKKLQDQIIQITAKTLIKNQIGNEKAQNILKSIISEEISGLRLKLSERNVLRKIGERGSARQREFREFGRNSGQDFSSNFLAKFHKDNLLNKSQEGTAVSYTLRGTAALAAKFDLFS